MLTRGATASRPTAPTVAAAIHEVACIRARTSGRSMASARPRVRAVDVCIPVAGTAPMNMTPRRAASSPYASGASSRAASTVIT
jgi:hypothetical protein